MASTSSKLPESKRPCDINNLMSPPEPVRFESFAHSNNMSKPIGSAMADLRMLSRPIPPLSPPISPATKADDHDMHVVMSASTPGQDPILYPILDITNSPQQEPLFEQVDSPDPRRIVKEHVLARREELFKDAPPPKQDDYELVLFFQSQVMKKYLENPRSWLQRERALLIADRRAQARNRQFKFQRRILPAKPQAVRKEAQREKPAKAHAPKVTKQAAAKHPRPIRAGPSPPTNLTKPVARVPSATPDPSSRRTGASNRADVDWNTLPDYCPPTSSLPSKPNSLKIDWKGSPTDLSNDPDRGLLHPDEVMLASNLRLSCAAYLTSKRRMFMRRLECLQKNKEFRRTDAQQACHIDVNKASKLWAAFEKVGWLDKAWVQPFL
ncbi:SWIRM domain-containing protein [Xylariaceae sp. AK1471]|nr:SWIRM domain-containing protein [Xylariaceae sp. AK1471]